MTHQSWQIRRLSHMLSSSPRNSPPLSAPSSSPLFQSRNSSQQTPLNKAIFTDPISITSTNVLSSPSHDYYYFSFFPSLSAFIDLAFIGFGNADQISRRQGAPDNVLEWRLSFVNGIITGRGLLSHNDDDLPLAFVLEGKYDENHFEMKKRYLLPEFSLFIVEYTGHIEKDKNFRPKLVGEWRNSSTWKGTFQCSLHEGDLPSEKKIHSKFFSSSSSSSNSSSSPRGRRQGKANFLLPLSDISTKMHPEPNTTLVLDNSNRIEVSKEDNVELTSNLAQANPKDIPELHVVWSQGCFWLLDNFKGFLALQKTKKDTTLVPVMVLQKSKDFKRLAEGENAK